MKRIIVLLVLASSMTFSQVVTNVNNSYVVIDTDTGIGEIGDEIVVYRTMNGENLPVGSIKLVKFSNGKTGAKITEQVKGHRIRKNDFVLVESIFSSNDKTSNFNRLSAPTMKKKKDTFGFGIGLSIPVGEGGEYWYIGPKFGIQLSRRISPTLEIGCSGAGFYNVLNEGNFKRDLGYSNMAAIGMSIGFELSSFLKLYLSKDMSSKTQPFIECGFGSCSVSTKLTTKASYGGYSASGAIDGQNQGPLVSFGAGFQSYYYQKRKSLKLKKNYEIIALYYNLLNTNTNTSFVSVTTVFLL